MKEFVKRFFSLTAILLFFFTRMPANAQSQPVNYLGIENGLSNNSVRCVYQDRDGFMWFGTYDGLNRYDGYQFKVYRNNLNDSNSLPHNYIYSINEDQHKNIWVGTGQGIGIYNKRTSKFTPAFYTPYLSDIKEKITSNINAIETDREGNVLIGTNGWGFLVQFEGTDIAKQLPVEYNAKEISTFNVQAITIDKQQRAWLQIQDIGLCRFDHASGKIVLVTSSIKSVKCLEADNENNLWIGTDAGLYRYSIPANAITLHYKEETGKLSSNNITALNFDKQQRLWIGTEGGGINILNAATHTFEYLVPGEDKNNLSSESAFAVYEDTESRIWIGTLKGGINIIDQQKSQFQTIAHSTFNQNSLVNNFVSSFIEDDNEKLWIGTDGGGMSVWNRKQNSFTNYKYNPGNKNSLSHNSVTSIARDHQHNTWIATYGGGINKFNEATSSFEHYKCINDSTRSENKNVWLLYEDSKNNLWASTFGNGKLYLFNRALNRFEAFDQHLNDLIAISEDRDGTLWAGNSYQLTRIDQQRKQHGIYNIGKPIRAIYEDKKGAFWLGTEGGGLILFNRSEGKIKARFSVDNGLCNNSVLNIVEDKNGLLWLSTFNGLSRFDPKTKTFKNYFQSDGLQSNQFLYNAALRLNSGEIVFGGINGFNIFYPDSLKQRDHFAHVMLTGLRMNNLPVSNDHAYVTSIHADKIAALKIPYNTAIAFDFAAIEYSAPDKIQYAYFLEGWDRGWTYTGNVRTANYTHLKEGRYTLRIKSTNSEGIWNRNETSLQITILPPWFRTWWVYLIYISGIAVIVFFYLDYKASQTKLKYKVKLAQLNAEKEKEINEKKLAFFTNVSHEFRTPLTLIINPAKELLKTAGEENEEVKENVDTIYRNARRLLSLVDQLLLFKKADSDADNLVISLINFENLCKEVYNCFAHQARAKNITYQFESIEGNYEVYGDKEKIEIILFNLISNALKYTPENGKVVISTIATDEDIRVSVADTGEGISIEVGNKLYERFYRDETVNRFSKIGFGIGLFLTRHFIDIHKGEINYKSEEGKGTTFTVSLKKGYSHFDQQLIATQVTEESAMLKELIEEPMAKSQRSGLEEMVMDRQSLLVIDDDRQLREYVVSIFSHRFVVYEAESGEEGLAIAQQKTPNIIISDIAMSNMNGMDLCRNIKASPELRHIPVVLLTGSSSKDTMLKSAELGADDYITKPFERDFLVARVESILKSRSDLQQYFYKEITLQKNDLKISPEDKEFLNSCIKIVEDHLNDDQFSIQKLASEIGMSHSNLYQKVKAISGQSVNGFVRFIRLRKAAELFISTDSNVNEVTLMVGINDKKYFREQFNKLFGMNPSDYIKKFRKPFNKTHTLSDKLFKP